MANVLLKNKNREHKRTVRSADGDSIDLPARSVHPVHSKFLWSLPPDVVEVKDKTVEVSSSKSPPAAVPASAPEVNSAVTSESHAVV